MKGQKGTITRLRNCREIFQVSGQISEKRFVEKFTLAKPVWKGQFSQLRTQIRI
jgi:hypothetical protein